ncbi:hypothetical protein Dimus_015368 [Dionaea muscipula]
MKNRVTKEKAREPREHNRISMAKRAVERFARDPDYGFLHESISDLFSHCSKTDMEFLDSGEPNKDSEEAHYAYRVRDRAAEGSPRPLRKALESLEVYMGASRWNVLPYNRVASVAMKTYRPLFRKHDARRFRSYPEKVKKGEAKIAAGARFPRDHPTSCRGGGWIR